MLLTGWLPWHVLLYLLRHGLWILLLLMTNVFGSWPQVSALLALHFPTGDILYFRHFSHGATRRNCVAWCTGVYIQVIFAVSAERLFFGGAIFTLHWLGPLSLCLLLAIPCEWPLFSFLLHNCKLIWSVLTSWKSRSLPKARPQTISLRRLVSRWLEATSTYESSQHLEYARLALIKKGNWDLHRLCILLSEYWLPIFLSSERSSGWLRPRPKLPIRCRSRSWFAGTQQKHNKQQCYCSAELVLRTAEYSSCSWGE